MLPLYLAFSTLLSEDLACITAGLLVAQGTIGWFPAAIACFSGIFAGDLLLFLAGRWLGRRVLQIGPLRRMITEEDIARTSRWFDRSGPSIVLASRFLPGSRLPTYFAAGALRTNLFSFLGYFALACLIWTPLLVGISAVAGEPLVQSFRSYSAWALPFALGAVLAARAALRVVRALSTWRGRRLLLSSWRRWTRWEFWPMWLFYPPIVLYVLWLGIRRRCLTLFTAVNPGMPAGGFVGESKSDILRALSGASGHVADHFLVEMSGDRAAAALQGIELRGWTYPVVLKPDSGERGAGVRIAKAPADMAEYFAASNRRVIVQEYVPGLEFGVFYVRRPQDPKGRIFAITEKRFPSVIGDGTKTLEDLILSDDRAVCMARFHLANHRGALRRVPLAGERVQLVELGTHSKGSLFLEGISHKTEPLEEAIDEVSRCFEGFYFGRYDVRTPSVEDFRQGRFKVIELNGVTSEATSMYDPSYGVFHAYHVLATQWRLAFEIAAENRRRGSRPWGFRDLVRLYLRSRKESAWTPTHLRNNSPKEGMYGTHTQSAHS